MTLRSEKCKCGHVARNHLSMKYGNMPRNYGKCRYCSCNNFEKRMETK